MVALASFPASGNTLMRYLIEGITGIFTGSFYYGSDYGPKGIKRQNLMYASPFAVQIKMIEFHNYNSINII